MTRIHRLRVAALVALTILTIACTPGGGGSTTAPGGSAAPANSGAPASGGGYNY